MPSFGCGDPPPGFYRRQERARAEERRRLIGLGMVEGSRKFDEVLHRRVRKRMAAERWR
jgi:hypothetical protein